jgi:chromosome segregation ATPase
MLSTIPTLAEIQSDHQQWLRELEHWEGDLVVSQNGQALLVKEIERLQKLVQAHGVAIQAHAASVKGLKEEIVSSEREMVALQGREPGRPMAAAHAKTEANYSAQQDQHERLKSDHQALFNRLALS